MRSKKVIEFSKDFVDNRPTTRLAPPAQAQAEPRLYGDAVASLLDFLIRRPAFDAALKDAPVPPSREAAPTTLKPPAPALPAPAAPPMAGMPAPPPLPTYSATEQVNMRPEFGQTMLAPREKTGFGSRLKQGLLSALAGASANAPSGDLGAMLGGAIAGGAGGAIRPQAGADLQHQVWVEPRRQAALQQAQQQQMLDLKGQQAGLAAEKTRAEIERLRRQTSTIGQPTGDEFASGPQGIYSRRTGEVKTPAAPKAGSRLRPVPGAAPGTFYDTETGEVTVREGVPIKPKEVSGSDAARDAEMEAQLAAGDTAAQQQQRANDLRPHVYQRLGISQQVLDLAQQGDSQAATRIQQAEQEIKRQVEGAMAGERKRDVAQRYQQKRGGGQGAPRSGGGPTRSVTDIASRYPGLKLD